MRWRTGRESENVEDRRGQGPQYGRGVRVGGIGGLGLIVVVVIALLTGIDPLALLSELGGGSAVPTGPTRSIDAPSAPRPAGADESAKFASVILADTEDTWGPIFAAAGRRYGPPRLVLFDGATPSACGQGAAAMGPFYCPLDQKVYLDLAFFRELERRFAAPGDFAQAYVIAHEVGHHVQNQLGIAERVQSLRQRVGDREANALSVRMELQADCLAGVWAHNANKQRKLLEPGDVEEGLRAAAAIGDDTIQRRSQGRVVPESWTHGSSEQRVRWFRRGMETGNLNECDTFTSARL
ncbi:MAG: neutral zinc metallopeptidase [Burkholderiales bacterium]